MGREDGRDTEETRRGVSPRKADVPGPSRCLNERKESLWLGTGWTDSGSIYREGAGAGGGPQESSLGHTHTGTQAGTRLGGCGCGRGELPWQR